MRITADVVMDATATIMRTTLVDDGYGSKSDARNVAATGIRCIVQPIIRTPQVDQVPGAKEVHGNHIIVFPWGTNIQPSDFIEVVNDNGNTDTFQIDVPYNNKQNGATSQYYCFKVI